MTPHHYWNLHQVQFPRSKYGVQEKIEGENVAAESMCFSGEVSRKIQKGDTQVNDVRTVSSATGYT